MIIYDLECLQGHTFEGWFNDIAAFEEQSTRRMISCPICGNNTVKIKPASVNVVGMTADVQQMPSAFSPQMAFDFISKHFEDVGEDFADVATKIHKGEETQRNIRGVTTRHEEEMLREEGVPFVKVQLPKFDV